MRYFTLKELTHSDTASQLGLDNTPGVTESDNLIYLVEKLLDPIRERYGAPIIVTSGYRSPAVNEAVGGVAASQHLRGEAADISAGAVTLNKQLFELIRTSGLEFDQLIDEKNYQWVHVSLTSRGTNRNQVLHL